MFMLVLRKPIFYIVNIATSLSQLGNTVLFAGNPDQTISARSYVNRRKLGWKKAYWIINALFFWQEDHCKESHQADVENAKKVLAGIL